MTPPSEVANDVVEIVAEFENVGPDDLPPLCDYLDGETRERLTEMGSSATEPLTFEYLWYHVTVLPGEEVVVTP